MLLPSASSFLQPSPFLSSLSSWGGVFPTFSPATSSAGPKPPFHVRAPSYQSQEGRLIPCPPNSRPQARETGPRTGASIPPLQQFCCSKSHGLRHRDGSVGPCILVPELIQGLSPNTPLLPAPGLPLPTQGNKADYPGPWCPAQSVMRLAPCPAHKLSGCGYAVLQDAYGALAALRNTNSSVLAFDLFSFVW